MAHGKSLGKVEPERFTHVKDLTPDPINRRSHNPRNIGMVVDALHAVGAARSIVIDEDGVILAGNGVVEAAGEAGITRVRVVEADGQELIAVRRTGLTPAQKRHLAIADNRGAELATWNVEQLAADLKNGEDLSAFFYEDELKSLLAGPDGVKAGKTDPDEVPAERPTGIVAGDLFELGQHRLLCGDCTKVEDVARLMAFEKAVMVHADPPYGMGKEKEGIANDNLYAEKLDAFQMAWWRACRSSLADNGSAYLWGNSEDLWRLWYLGGLQDSERLTLRNEIVWDKREDNPTMLVSGVPLESRRMYHPTERCLFFMLGEQGFNNNADNYWDGWEGIRSALARDCEVMGWDANDIQRICGVGMFGHWFTKSQWTFIPEEHYKKLQAAAREHDAFKREHDELKREHDELKREFYATRAYFDNTHDRMIDVWSFNRVTREDRYGHATPKPVEMVSRAILSSSPEGAAVLVPFGGTGPEVIAAEQLQRRAFCCEINPSYCQVIIDRWEAFTGLKAQKVGELVHA